MDSGLKREQIPEEPQPVRASKFVNPPPAVAPTWFQDRQVETGVLARYVTDPGIRMVTVVGRGGIGKTAHGVPAAEASQVRVIAREIGDRNYESPSWATWVTAITVSGGLPAGD